MELLWVSGVLFLPPCQELERAGGMSIRTRVLIVLNPFFLSSHAYLERATWFYQRFLVSALLFALG